MMTIPLLAVGIIAAAVVVAPAAHADPSGNEDGYLKVLADDGIEFPPAHRDSTVGFGYWICDSMRTFNRSEEQEASQIANVDLVGADPHRVRILVSAAHSQLCPDVP